MIKVRMCMGFLAVSLVCWGADTGVSQTFAETGRVRPITVSANDRNVPQVVDGATWQTTLILTNLSSTMAYYRIYFSNDDGKPLSFDFVGLGVGDTVTGQLPAGQTIEIATRGTAPTLSQGWADIFNYDRLATDPAALPIAIKTGGMAIFRRRLPGLPDQEAVVPISAAYDKNFTIPFDNRNGFQSGVAILNGSIQNGIVSVTARDNFGTILLTDSFQLNFFQKVVYLVPTKYPSLAGRAGILQYSINTSGFAGLGLRFNPTGSFTSTHPLTLAP